MLCCQVWSGGKRQEVTERKKTLYFFKGSKHTHTHTCKQTSSTCASFPVKSLIISRKTTFHQMRCSPGLYIKNAYQSKGNGRGRVSLNKLAYLTINPHVSPQWEARTKINNKIEPNTNGWINKAKKIDVASRAVASQMHCCALFPIFKTHFKHAKAGPLSIRYGHYSWGSERFTKTFLDHNCTVDMSTSTVLVV